jgi:hypothetical protein
MHPRWWPLQHKTRFFKRHAFGVVLRKLGSSDFRVSKNLNLIGGANRFATIDVDKYAHGLIPCRQMIRRSRDHSRGLGLSPGSSCKSHCQL